MQLLKNDFCQLRALEMSDVDFLYRLENDTSLWEVSQTLLPFSRYVLEQYIIEAQQDIYKSQQLRLAICSAQKQLVGCIDLYDFSPRNQRAGVGIALLPEHRKQGFALNALQLLCQYAFNFLHLHQLYAYVSQKNTASQRLFSKADFTPSGTKKDWILGAEGFEDVMIFQRIKQKINVVP